MNNWICLECKSGVKDRHDKGCVNAATGVQTMHIATVQTYTPDMPRPLCPVCGATVEPPLSNPEIPWKGTCSDNHTFWYSLVDDETEL
jgi:hypothetical protein